MRTSVKRRFPLRYWMLIAVSVGVPKFLEFDYRGKVKSWGTLNPWSFCQIGLMLSCGALFLMLILAGRNSIHRHPVNFHHKFWALILGIIAISTALSPKDNVFLSAYRLGEWLLLYGLLVSVYTRAPLEGALPILREVTMKIVNVSIAALVLFGLFRPTLAFMAPEEAGAGHQYRLGGELVQPNRLALIAAVGVLYAFIYLRGNKRALALALYGAVVFFTFSRGGWVALAVGLITYVLASSRHSVRAMGLMTIAGSAIAGFFVSDKLEAIVRRGQGSAGLTSLSARTEVWAAAVRAIRARPLIGYGYIDGVKQELAKLFSDPYWLPIHCHNEILQALVTGGIGLGLLITSLYLYLGFRFVRLWVKGGGDDALFFGLVFLQVLVYAFLTPVLLIEVLQPGALLMICCLVCFDALPKKLRLSRLVQQQTRALA